MVIKHQVYPGLFYLSILYVNKCMNAVIKDKSMQVLRTIASHVEHPYLVFTWKEGYPESEMLLPFNRKQFYIIFITVLNFKVWI